MKKDKEPDKDELRAEYVKGCVKMYQIGDLRYVKGSIASLINSNDP